MTPVSDIPSPVTREGWLKYLEDTPTCRFPASHNTKPGSVKDASCFFSIQPRNGPIGRFRSREALSEGLHIFKLAWAFVLRCYVGSDDVAFVTQTLSDRLSEAEVFRTDFECFVSWGEALAAADSSVVPRLRESHDTFPTAWSTFTSAATETCSTALVIDLQSERRPDTASKVSHSASKAPKVRLIICKV